MKPLPDFNDNPSNRKNAQLRQKLPDRSKLFGNLPEEQIVSNYRAVWGQDVGIEEAKAHARLEGELTDRLLLSTAENRWREFSDAYSRLYRELPWLNESEGAREVRDPRAWDFHAWEALVGRGRKLLEIGSGHGHLIRHLSLQGNSCYATEITQERGEKFVPKEDVVHWLQMDGVNLTQFVPENSFDVVVSDQVFEHLHPDDHVLHLSEVRKVLVANGRYILRAPHRSTGPHDVSRVFGAADAVFMHLCEPNYLLMRELVERAGFRKVSAVLALRRAGIIMQSALFMRYQMLIDRLENRLAKTHAQRLRFREFARFLLGHRAVWIVAEK